MTTRAETANTVLDWTPDAALVKSIADRVTDAYGPHARLDEIGLHALAGGIPEADDPGTLDDWQVETLFEAVRDELAARDDGKRR